MKIESQMVKWFDISAHFTTIREFVKWMLDGAIDTIPDSCNWSYGKDVTDGYFHGAFRKCDVPKVEAWWESQGDMWERKAKSDG